MMRRFGEYLFAAGAILLEALTIVMVVGVCGIFPWVLAFGIGR
jgi:hypothetical protein